MKKHQLQKKTITTTEKTAEEFENMITGMDEESFRNIIRREVAAANSSKKRIKRGFEFQEERLVKKQKSEEEGPPSNSKPRKFHSRQRKRFYFQRERKAR